MDVDGRVKARDDLLNASADAAAEARPFTLALCPWGRMALERRRATATEEKQRCAKLDVRRRAESREEPVPCREVGESSPSTLTVALRRATAGAGVTSSGTSSGTSTALVRVPSASPARVPPCAPRAAPCTVLSSASPSRSCVAATVLGMGRTDGPS